jgi:thymidylate kinase
VAASSRVGALAVSWYDVDMSESRRPSIALEGPCCAGKTTLGHGLVRAFQGGTFTYVPDYSDYMGGGRHLPPPVPESLEAEEVALWEFMRIEAERTCEARERKALPLIDRSVHTLKAHCYGLRAKSNLNFPSVADAIIDGSTTPLWPAIILYLDVDDATINKRNGGKFPPGNVFIDTLYNRGIREYFSSLSETDFRTIHFLDGTRTQVEVCDEAVRWVESYVHSSVATRA